MLILCIFAASKEQRTLHLRWRIKLKKAISTPEPVILV